jgi:predicted transcriptional regulator
LKWRFAFSPDGKVLASGEINTGTLKLWDMRTRKEKIVLQEDPDLFHIHNIAFSPDGRTLAVASSNYWIVLWEMATNKERASFGTHLPIHSRCDFLAFSPDGGKLIACADEGTIQLWNLNRIRCKPPDAAELARLWSALAGEDAVAAYRAIRTLVVSPPQTLPLLRNHLQSATPPPEPPTEKIKRWLADLDSDDFATRQKVEHELEKCGLLAVPALRKALTVNVSLEFRKRVNAILEHIERTRAAQELQQLRALEVLEYIGTVEARGLLEDLAKGVPEARLTQEAKASLARLAKRTASKP